MVNLIDPTSASFLLVENRTQPMHVGALTLMKRPEGAGREFSRELYEWMKEVGTLSPLFRKHPVRSLRTAGQLAWEDDAEFDIEHHVRHSALPKPGRVRELLDLCGRLHASRMDPSRPMWESHVIEGLRDGRVAMYTKLHHSLVDGVAAVRLMQAVLSSDPHVRDMPPPWADRPRYRRPGGDPLDLVEAVRGALSVSSEALGLPGALGRTLTRGVRNETSTISLHAPRTMLNQRITGARRFAAQDWEVSRMRAVGKATGTTINDVVVAMCSGALRRYLLDFDALPAESLVAMVPVSLKARQAQVASTDGGNALGSLMVALGTHLESPEARLESVHESMRAGKEALSQMTPLQVTAMSALGQAPAIAMPLLGLAGTLRPAYNLVISNVPGPREPQYLNGAEVVGSYPLSIPIHGVALNITCSSYAGKMCFGLTGCRRTVPHLQRLLTYLDDELKALEKIAGV